MARVPMTADSECPQCKGTGWRKKWQLPPGESLRFGGGPQGREVSVVCGCVRAESPTEESGER